MLTWHSDDEDEALAGAVYPPGLAGALAGVSGNSIGQWARHGLIRPTLYEGPPANLYSYFDVAEALVIRWMLEEGVSHRDIRLALDRVRGHHPRWPLLRADLGVGRLSVDDRARLVRREGPGVYVDATGRDPEGWIMLPPVLLGRARDMLAHGGWIAASHRLDRIEVAPYKLGGVPTLRDRRWTIDAVARLADDQAGREALRRDHGIGEREIDEARIWVRAARELVT
jgi:DNA-binding transcriptional MerR regulator/uncharacterized protein (DUF433 family)